MQTNAFTPHIHHIDKDFPPKRLIKLNLPDYQTLFKEKMHGNKEIKFKPHTPY